MNGTAVGQYAARIWMDLPPMACHKRWQQYTSLHKYWWQERGCPNGMLILCHHLFLICKELGNHVHPPNKHVMSTYIPSASVSNHLEDRHCLVCLTRLAGTLTVMTMIPQLRMGSCVNKIMYTTKGPTYERGNKTSCNSKALMPVLQILHACRYFHPQEDRIDRIQ